jgi:hypothetical protein
VSARIYGKARDLRAMSPSDREVAERIARELTDPVGDLVQPGFSPITRGGKKGQKRLRPIKGRELKALKHIMLEAVGVSDMSTAIWATEYGPRLVRQLEREREKNQSHKRKIARQERRIKKLRRK